MSDGNEFSPPPISVRLVRIAAVLQVVAMLLAILMVSFPSPIMMLVGLGGGIGLGGLGVVLYLVGAIKALRQSEVI